MILFVLFAVLPFSASEKIPDEAHLFDTTLTAHLLDIATASLNAQLNVLTNAASASNATQELATYYQAAIQQKLAAASVRRAALVADGILYGQYTLQLTMTDLQIDGDMALFTASEYTVIELDNAKTDPLAPQTTEYVDEHVFHFQLLDGSWYLLEDQVRMPPKAES